MAIWATAQGAYNVFKRSKPAQSVISHWRRWGRFVFDVPSAGADIAISEDKAAAIGAQAAALVTAAFLRKTTGAKAFIFPLVSYAATRYAISRFTGKGETRGGGTVGQKIVSDIVNIGEPNKPANPIKGHDEDHWGREQIFESGDFEPGASWKGLLGALRRPVKAYQAWRLGKGLARGAELYESMAHYALAYHGVTPTAVKTFIAKPLAGERHIAGVIGLQAVGNQGETLISAVRSFSPEKVVLEDIKISKAIRNKGIGSFLRRGESAIFQRMGYKAGTPVESPLASPITARIHLQTYGGVLETHVTHTPKNLESRILAKEVSTKEYEDVVTLAVGTGRLPSNKALNKILGHEMRWGRTWVHRVLDTDFAPGSSWIGQAVKRGVSWAKIGEAAMSMREPAAKFIAQGFGSYLEGLYKTGGLAAVSREIRQTNIVATEGRRFVLGKRLGEGSFKDVFEAYEIGRTAKAGEKFIYAQIHPGTSETLLTTPFLRTGTAGAVEGSLGIPETKKFVETYRQSMQAHMAQFADNPLGAEVAAQQLARKSYGMEVPGVIGLTEKGFVQEYAGTMLPEPYIGKAYQAAQTHYEKILANSGTKVVHYDLHPGNILRKGTKLSIIDWGLAAPTAVTPEIAQTGQQLMDFYVKRQASRFGVRDITRTAPAFGKGIFSRAGTPEELLQQLETNKDLVTRGAAKRKQRLNRLQEAAQPLPFQLNAKRRMSHGIDRSKRSI
jgi:tRNA A-37 threonylcarbamoyl transferase component Bud32